MKPNKGSGQKSLRSKISHEKKLAESGVKNVGMHQDNDFQEGKRPLGQDGQMNKNADDASMENKR